MAEDISEQDRIRNKRLAKLGTSAPPITHDAASNTANQSSTPNESPAQAENSKPSINISKASSTSSNPFSQLSSQKPPQTSTKPINVHPAATRPTTTPDSTQSTPRPRQQKQESIEDWEHKQLCSVFRITLDPERTQDVHGNILHYCGDVHEELSNEDALPRFTTNKLESAIMDAASNQEGLTVLEYMLSCWKRLSRTVRSLRLAAEDPKYQILKETRRLCMSYCIFAVNMPEMFGQETPGGGHALTPFLKLDPDSERGIDQDFLTEVVSRFDEDESAKEMMVDAMVRISQDLQDESMNGDYKPSVTALQSYTRHNALVVALAESEHFLPDNTAAQDIEKKTLLGPFFRISPLQGEVAMTYFSNSSTRDRGYIMNAQNALRLTLQTHQTELFDVVDRFIKANKLSRDRILDWFAHSINTNHKRRAMRPDPQVISTDGFMLNVTVCLDRLCEPFMDATFSKIGRIEAEYFRRSPRVDIKDETKINADQSTADAFYNQHAEGANNFISEVFFLAVASHHYGPEATNSKLSGLKRDIRHMEQTLQGYEGQRERYASSPQALQMFDTRLRQFKEKVEKAQSVLHAIEGVMADELMQARAMSVMRYVIVWLMRLVSGVDFPRQTISVPLPADQPEVFRCLPEYFLEDIVDHFKWVTSHIPQVITPTQCDELVMICITFLRSSEYVKNPYLKSGLISILFYGTLATRANARGALGDVLNSLPFANKHLLHAMMQFYIECEVTGAHTQFYDKFNIRYEIFQVIKAIWTNTIYRENMMIESKENPDFFVQFVNLILNDVTFVLDEVLTAFASINELSKDLENPSAFDEQERKAKEEALEAASGRAKSYMQLTNESLATLILFTEHLADAFTSPEIVQRLADMLDYNLETLTGPKSGKLRVKNPEEYRYNPKHLLNEVTSVYLNLGHKLSFQQAIARDGRSYKPQLFENALSILMKFHIKSEMDISKLRELADNVKRAKEEEDAEEEDLGEIPDEFLDPLVYTLMKDPVILPISKTVMDRSTIRQHLLSDPHDPFNRAPLKIEDVIPDTETKSKIEAFIAEKKAAKRANADRMDTTPG